MTLWDTLRALARRWPIVLVGMLVTAGVGLLAIRDPGVYFTRMQVVFLAPSTWYRNVLQTTPEAVIVTASAVSKRVVGAADVIKYGSLDATIIGTTSIREGVWIRAEDQGGQWAPDLRTPIIVVDVVGPSADRVREMQYDAIRRIQDELDSLQGELQPARRDLITMQVAPEATALHHVGGDRRRALAMIGALGASVTLSMVVALESRKRRRERASARVARAVTHDDRGGT